MKACGTSDDGSAGWTASRTFETEEELHVLPAVFPADREESLASAFASSLRVFLMKINIIRYIRFYLKDK